MCPLTYLRLGLIASVGLASAYICGIAGARPAPDKELDSLAAGKELFTRQWLHSDNRSFAGDGLGPVFNARSCAECHKQGGIGGAGPKENNATIVSTFVDLSSPKFSSGIAVAPPDPSSPVKQPNREMLAEIHPALRTDSSFPVHRFGADRAFQEWKRKQFGEEKLSELAHHQTRVDGVLIEFIPSERNTPTLYGSGLIDRIPDSVLVNAAAKQAWMLIGSVSSKSNQSADLFVQVGNRQFTRRSLPVSGRVSRLADGKIGRFGWKANVATLRDFTLQACANELGLESPGFPRAVPPWIKNYKAPGLDISVEQADSLVGFVASLPPPVARAAQAPQQATELAAGQKLFGKIGCAVCHTPKLGEVDGIYSDLLLHDMGEALSGTGFYGTNIEFVKSNGKVEPLPIDRDPTSDKPTKEKPPKFGAASREWRTPPLWGLRDSAPYLHDGRAETIEEAIRAHDGEGTTAAQAYEKLERGERDQVVLFLGSLGAPTTDRPR